MEARERYYTVKEAADDYFQGKVSAREVYNLFASGELRGFRVGSGKGKILIYKSSLDAYRLARENRRTPAEPPLLPAQQPDRRRKEKPVIPLTRLPG